MKMPKTTFFREKIQDRIRVNFFLKMISESNIRNNTLGNPSSFLIASRNRPEILQDCLDNLLSVIEENDEVIVIVHMINNEYKLILKKYIKERIKFLTYNKNTSLSHLWNLLIQESKHTEIFIMNDKARPNKEAIKKSKYLLSRGIGLCGLYRFGFFHFSKYLIYQIGWFEERFSDGGFEDSDFLRRLYEKDIAYYENEEIEYVQRSSQYLQKNSKKIFFRKWQGELEIKRGLREQNLYKKERLSYKKYKREFLAFKNTFVMAQSHKWFQNVIKNRI